MNKSTIAKRFFAVAIALGITLATNYAISLAERSGTPNNPDSPRPRVELTERSGTPNNPDSPRPRVELRDRSGTPNNPDSPRPQ
ncbi:MAG: hypothetical protein FJ217_09125 [Ignavibacteria bacterium]|nr:hypothetical protein [Ignavibacteria bacterium]